jgi:Gpi18-like mannosyltransferase
MPDRRIFRAAVLAFLLSRLIFFALLIAGSQIAFLGKVYSGSVWETRIVLDGARVRPELERTVMIGDAWWYRSIATGGYEARAIDGKPANWAFFPLFPLAVRYLAPTGSFAFDAMLLTNVAFFGALLLLGMLAVRSGLIPEDAERAIFYLAFFPTSYFFSLPLTESLFLLLSLGAFVSAKDQRWWAAGVLGGLAALTRVTGIFLFPALLLLGFERMPQRKRQLAWLALIPAGTAAFMLHLYRVTGDALAFAHVQSSWNRHLGWFWRPLAAYLANPLAISEPWNLTILGVTITVMLLAATIVLFLRRQWSFALYTGLSTLLPLTTGSLQSMARYALVVFPLFLILALAGRSHWLDRIITAVTITLYGWLIALLTLRVDFALA